MLYLLSLLTVKISRLDNHWRNQDIIYDYKSENTDTKSLSEINANF